MGFNFPQTTMFQDAALFPPIIFGFRLNYSLIIPLLFTVFVWIYMERHFGGFQLVVGVLRRVQRPMPDIAQAEPSGKAC